jgi:hypothetical protein
LQLLGILDTSDSMSQDRISIPERELYFGSHYGLMYRLILMVLTMFLKSDYHGVSTILQSKRIVLMAWGQNKRVIKTIQENISLKFLLRFCRITQYYCFEPIGSIRLTWI